MTLEVFLSLNDSEISTSLLALMDLIVDQTTHSWNQTEFSVSEFGLLPGLALYQICAMAVPCASPSLFYY